MEVGKFRGLYNTSYGHAVAIDGDTLVIGAPLQNTGIKNSVGRIYIRYRNPTKPEGWESITGIVPEPEFQHEEGYFGWSVTVDGDTCVVGAPQSKKPGEYFLTGLVFVYGRDTGGQDNWGEIEWKYGDGNYGRSVSARDGLLAVGAPFELTDPNVPSLQSGATYLYKVFSDGSYESLERLTPYSGGHIPMIKPHQAGFGYSVFIGDDIFRWMRPIAVGAPHGHAVYSYLFRELNLFGVQEITDLSALPVVSRMPIVLNENVMAVGYNDQVYIYRFDPINATAFRFWQYTGNARAYDGLSRSHFGEALASDGPWLAVGSPRDSQNGDESGAVYMLYPDGDGWKTVQKLLASDGAAGDRFGFSVAMDNNTLVVGAPGANAVYYYSIGSLNYTLPPQMVRDASFHHTIDTDETILHEYENKDSQELYLVLSFGSEFNLKVYQPSGSLYLERQSVTSPIEVLVEGAAPGLWKFEITAIEASKPDDPYILAVVLSDTDGDRVSDSQDNCPAAPNPDQKDGDEDSIGDACDCEGNFDADGDVDGSDLTIFTEGYTGISIEEFAEDFGNIYCQ
jgi:hypothetical protein